MIQRARLERALLLDKLDTVKRKGEEMELSPPESPEPIAAIAENVPIAPSAAPSSSGNSKKSILKVPNAYTVYCQEEREAVIQMLHMLGQKNPKAVTIRRHLSDQWKALSKEQKKPYSEKAHVIKESQKREMEEFEAHEAETNDQGVTDSQEPQDSQDPQDPHDTQDVENDAHQTESHDSHDSHDDAMDTTGTYN